MYSIDPHGGFGTQPTQYPTLVQYVPAYAALGLQIVPLIDAAGGVGGMAALLRNPTPFITAAVDAALKKNYSGYNFACPFSCSSSSSFFWSTFYSSSGVCVGPRLSHQRWCMGCGSETAHLGVRLI
jgi:hypothetical protein